MLGRSGVSADGVGVAHPWKGLPPDADLNESGDCGGREEEELVRMDRVRCCSDTPGWSTGRLSSCGSDTGN